MYTWTECIYRGYVPVDRCSHVYTEGTYLHMYIQGVHLEVVMYAKPLASHGGRDWRRQEGSDMPVTKGCWVPSTMVHLIHQVLVGQEGYLWNLSGLQNR